MYHTTHNLINTNFQERKYSRSLSLRESQGEGKCHYNEHSLHTNIWLGKNCVPEANHTVGYSVPICTAARVKQSRYTPMEAV